MKKTARVLALVMALMMVTLVFASCGKTLKGTYAAEIAGSGVEYEFSGKNVTATVKVLGKTVAEMEGTYKIKDDKITFTFEGEDKDAEEYNGEFDFEETEDGIKIGEFEYKKK